MARTASVASPASQRKKKVTCSSKKDFASASTTAKSLTSTPTLLPTRKGGCECLTVVSGRIMRVLSALGARWY